MALLLGVGFGLLPGGQGAWAAPATVCTVSDARLPNVTGMVALSEGYAVITNPDDSIQQVKIFLLDAKCTVTGTLTSDIDPRDTEDLAHTADGTYWVADIGDNDTNPDRATVAVHEFPTSGTKTIQRMRFPDGAKNAAALLVQNNNVPVIITKAAGTAKVYKATKAITGPSKSAAEAVPLVLVGTVTLAAGETVTGGAMAPDGNRVALRTAASIYEWDVTGGDMAASIVNGKPRKTGLTGQTGTPGGAVAYSTNGKSFITAPAGNPAALQSWPIPAAAVAKTSASASPDSSSGGSLLSGISFNQITALVGVVGVIGLALLVAGIVGIVRFRRRSAEEPLSSAASMGGVRGLGPEGRPGGPDSLVPVDETMHLPRVSGAVYGGGRPGPEPARGGAAVVPPSPRDGRPGGPVGAGVGPVSGPGQGAWSARSEAGFRSEGPVSGPAGGPARGGAAVGPVSGAARGGAAVGPVSGPAGSSARGGGTVYGGGMPADAQTTGAGRVRRPQGGGRPGPDDPATTGAGRVRRPPPADPATTGAGRVRRPPARGPGDTDPPRGRDASGRAAPPPPVDRSAPTRSRRAAPPPMPPGTYGRDGDRRGGRDGWEGQGRDGATGGRPRPQGGDRMRPPPPPGERPDGDRGRRDPTVVRRDGEGRPPAPPGRRPPAPPERARRDNE